MSYFIAIHLKVVGTIFLIIANINLTVASVFILWLPWIQASNFMVIHPIMFEVSLFHWPQIITYTKQICIFSFLCLLISVCVGLHAHMCVIGYRSASCHYPATNTSMPVTLWTGDVESSFNHLQANYTPAGDRERALQPQYRGLFIRLPPNQHTDDLSDWDQKKPVFDTSLLVLSVPSGFRLLLFPHLGLYQPTAHLIGLSIF